MQRLMMTVFTATLTLPVLAADEIKITPIQIEEVRVKQLSQEKEARFPAESELKIQLHVEGESINDATSYGKVQLEQAVDDTGADLKPKKRGFMSRAFGGGDEWTSLKDGMMAMEQEKKEKGFRIEIALKVPARKATRLTGVKGKFPVLAGGEAKTTKISRLLTIAGKVVEDPVLKSAGIEVLVKDPKKKGDMFGGGDNALSIEVKGNLKTLQKIDVVDAQGESVKQFEMSMGGDDKKTYSIGLKGPPDDSMILKIDLQVGLREITVPFDLKDIALP